MKMNIRITPCLPRLLFAFPAVLLGIVFLPGCASNGKAPKPGDGTTASEEPANPFPEGTYEYFKASADYRKTYAAYWNKTLLANTSASDSFLVIDLSDQRARLINRDAKRVALDYPVSSGKKDYRTPTGKFRVLEKLAKKHSNLYGRIVDAKGKTLVRDATNGETPVPPGAKFVGASMPYWIRFTWDGIGHHIGRVRRYPVSHGCVRGRRSAMTTVFSKVRVGTPVIIQN